MRTTFIRLLARQLARQLWPLLETEIRALVAQLLAERSVVGHEPPARRFIGQKGP